jgi:predicted sulfurtransferase
MGLGRRVGPRRGAQVTCDRCDKPINLEDKRECEVCCEVLCSSCMCDFALCYDCEALQEEEAAFLEEFEP